MKNAIVLIAVLISASICYSQPKPSICPIKDFKGKTSEFGNRIHPILKVEQKHEGIDFFVRKGTPVRATASGIVVQAEMVDNFGVVVRLQHDKTYETFYAHLSKLAVKKGATVRKGQIIAYSGNSGVSTGPHLHYEVIENGVQLNPREFIVSK